MTKRQRKGWTNKTTLVGSVAEVYKSRQIEESAEIKSLSLKGSIKLLKQMKKEANSKLVELENFKQKVNAQLEEFEQMFKDLETGKETSYDQESGKESSNDKQSN